jgi:Uncharacterised methyltransferase family (DUF6094)
MEGRRTEQAFLSHTYRWLRPGGVLVFVIPGERLVECSQILASHFRDVRIYRLESAECVRYKHVVVFGIRRNGRERERLQDADIARARLRYASLARRATELPALPREPDAQYKVPPGQPVRLVCRGLPLDQIEDLLPCATAYRQAGQILFAEARSTLGQPLTPLHAGQKCSIRRFVDFACKSLRTRIVSSGRYPILKLLIQVLSRTVPISAAH